MTENDEAVATLLGEIQAQEKRLRRRKESNRWFWALCCVAGLIGMVLFSAYALRSVGQPGPRFPLFLVLTIASTGLAILGFSASRYHTHTE